MKFTDEHRKNLSLANSGEKHHAFNNWSSREPYSKEWSKEFKDSIRKRDNYTCQECGHTQKQLGYTLQVHHIDYDKKNCNVDNLISLCKSCHVKTNFNRDNWINYYKKKIEAIEYAMG